MGNACQGTQDQNELRGQYVMEYSKQRYFQGHKAKIKLCTDRLEDKFMQLIVDQQRNFPQKYLDKRLDVEIDTMKFGEHPPHKFRKTKAVYTGQWSNNLKHGYGVEIWPDGTIYKGYWKENMANGKGYLQYPNFEYYDGQWENSQYHGFGILSDDAQTERYEGTWEEGKKCGKGKQIYKDGSIYEGEYGDDKKDGQGIFKWNDGSIYEGGWSQDTFHDRGKFVDADGCTYIGQYEYNHMSGHGIQTWPDGRRYEGQFKNDLRHGKGTYWWADGRKWSGYWKKGKQHGKGIYVSANKITRYGFWQYGIKQYWDDGDEEFSKREYDMGKSTMPSLDQQKNEAIVDNQQKKDEQYNMNDVDGQFSTKLVTQKSNVVDNDLNSAQSNLIQKQLSKQMSQISQQDKEYQNNKDFLKKNSQLENQSPLMSFQKKNSQMENQSPLKTPSNTKLKNSKKD